MKALEKSQIIFAHLSNLNKFVTSLNEETQKSIKENNRIGGAYSIWLDDVKQQVISAVKENKPEIQISMLNLNSNRNKQSKELFPKSNLLHGLSKENINQFIEKLFIEKKGKKSYIKTKNKKKEKN